AEREEFLRIFGDCYGYHGRLQSVRHEEFRRLAGQVYLDYAGAALYSERQIQACSEELLTTLLCNPHSAPASTSADAMSALRRDTLELLNADGRQYEVIITSGATAALKMVAECFPWSAGASCLAHPAAVHNSVLGMRGPALAAGAAVQLVPVVSPLGPLITADGGASDGLRGGGGGGTAAAAGPSGPRHLLALPVECNFTGDRQHLADAVRNDAGGGGAAASGRESRGRWLVLLDAAKACATAPPDLSVVPADFVVLSYYKIFGYPTGLGALVARKDALALLAAGKSYFGGGTVEVAVADRPYHVRRQGAPGFEDGTPPFTSIAAARHGFAFLHRLGGLPAVHRHSCCLARWLTIRLAALRHANGTPVCMLYGSVLDAEHGPTVSFNLLRPDGSWVGYTEVGRLAAMHGLVLRTGCFCNPGACAEWLGLTAEDLIRHHKAGHVCWDDHDLADGRPTGAVRVSLGAVSTFEDVHAVLQLIRRYFYPCVDQTARGGCTGRPPLAAVATAAAAAPHLSRILFYPVKSCAPQVVQAWPIGPTGLLYDREWALVDDGGKVLTLKQCPRMALVRPVVDLTRGTLTIHAPHDIHIPPLELAIPGLFHSCRRIPQVVTEGDTRVRQWFGRTLGAPCRIVQQRTGASALEAGGGGKGAAAAEGEPSVGFANDGQYLLVSEVNDDRPATAKAGGREEGGKGGHLADDLVTRLRPNLVVSGFQPYEEDSWAAVRVGPLHADVLGTCPRCELLQVDPRVGVRRGAEVLVALAQYRRRGGKVQFGVLL
ncbi:hypothetical protein VOLCADRAFT_40621, partial [Volvox carteri f. nagariensis]